MNHSNREDQRPAELWFWDDWFAAMDIKMCSLAAQGLWVNMLGIMSRSKIKGTLTVNGKQIESKDLANLLGKDSLEILTLMKELEIYGVFSRLPDGTIINRRMYREGEVRRKRAEAGRLGGRSEKQNESKALSKDVDNVQSKTKATLEDEDVDVDLRLDLFFDFSSLSWRGITEKDKASWAKAYPACDIDLVLSQMAEWIKANPAKGKKSNYRRFITNWFKKEQDRGGSGGRGVRVPAADRLSGIKSWLRKSETVNDQ